MRRCSILGTFMCCMSLMVLGGCDTVKVPYKDEDHVWATRAGHATVIVRASAIFGQKRYYCANLVENSFLFPDTPYYRDWIRVLQSPYHFKGDITRKAKALLRKAPRQALCTFVFRNVPAGKWVFFGNIQHYLAQPQTYWVSGMELRSNISGFNLLWGGIVVQDDMGVIARQVVQDGNRRNDIGLFKVRHFGAAADVSTWHPTEEEMKGLGLSDQEIRQVVDAK
ncbi:hypothetical protein [Bombella mellum]|nr:hypothetical protein [Bombella mellum]